jgi:cytoskeletal protein RodZ
MITSSKAKDKRQQNIPITNLQIYVVAIGCQGVDGWQHLFFAAVAACNPTLFLQEENKARTKFIPSATPPHPLMSKNTITVATNQKI